LQPLENGPIEVPEKPNDYDYYDQQSQAGARYMQSMRRNWNPNNRGIRSGVEFESSELLAQQITLI